MTTYRTVRAAETLLTDETRDTWGLADAVLSDVPADSRGGDRRSDHSTTGGGLVPDRLAAIVDTLAERGITTMTGESYTVTYLAHLREMAMTWPTDTRHHEAAFRTHREAGNYEARQALDALCAVGRGESKRRPPALTADGWEAAKARVRQRAGLPRPPRFLVTANDVRLAMGRRVNVPTKITPEQVREAVKANPAIVVDDPETGLAIARERAEQSAVRVKRETERTADRDLERMAEGRPPRGDGGRAAVLSPVQLSATLSQIVFTIRDLIDGFKRDGMTIHDKEHIELHAPKIRAALDDLEVLAATADLHDELADLLEGE